MVKFAGWIPTWGAVLAALLLAGCVYPPGVGLVATGSVEVDEWDEPPCEEAGGDGWCYKEVEGTSCANGSPVGMGVNKGDSPVDLMIYLSGGGACWNTMRCNFFQTAANMDVSYDADQLGKELHPLTNAGLFDRDNSVNPLAHANYAYIPYCTGDLHTGRKMTTYGGFRSGAQVNHVGAHNLQMYLQRLPELFPHVERLWLVGISAGGYGIAWNFEHFREAFPDAEVHVFTDAAPWVPIEEERWRLWQQNWGFQMPDGCERCVEQPEYLQRYLAEKYPESRFATTLFARDAVLSAYMGMLPGGTEQSVVEFIEENYSHPNTRAFVASGADHEVLLHLDDGVRSRDGERLSEFFRHWVAGW